MKFIRLFEAWIDRAREHRFVALEESIVSVRNRGGDDCFQIGNIYK